MLLKGFLTALFLCTSATLATWSAYEEYSASPPSANEAKRPKISYQPNQPWKLLPSSPARYKTCKVKTHDDMKTDDSASVLKALHECNNGGRVLFPSGKTYVIGKPLDMTFLKHVDIGRPPSLTYGVKASTNSPDQSFKAMFNGQITPITGKRTASNRFTRTQPRSSSWAARMSMSTVAACSMATVRCGMTSTHRMYILCDRFCSGPSDFIAEPYPI